MATKFAQKSRGDAQLEYREDHLADVVAENLEQHFVDLRCLALAPHQVPELPLALKVDSTLLR
jgi:hypothetical protein